MKWSVNSENNGTTISEDGLLTIGIDETLEELIVTAEENGVKGVSKVTVKPHPVFLAVPIAETEIIQGLANPLAYVNIKKFRDSVMINEQDVRADNIGKFSLDYVGLTTNVGDVIEVKQKLSVNGLYSDIESTTVVEGHVPTLDMRVINAKLSMYVNSRGNANVVITDNEGNVFNGSLDREGVLIYPLQPKLTTTYYDVDIIAEGHEHIKQRVEIPVCTTTIDGAEGNIVRCTVKGIPGLECGFYDNINESNPYTTFILDSTAERTFLLYAPSPTNRANKFYYEYGNTQSVFRQVEYIIGGIQ